MYLMYINVYNKFLNIDYSSFNPHLHVMHARLEVFTYVYSSKKKYKYYYKVNIVFFFYYSKTI